MTLVLLIGPEAEPITLDEARLHLRLDTTDDDGLVQRLIVAARQNLDGKDGWLGRALVAQTWILYLDAFPAEIRLPLPPLRSISSIKYIDTTGAEQTLDPAVYRLKAGEQGRIIPAYGQSWPATRHDSDAVKIEFIAGYIDDCGEDIHGEYSSVPAPIRTALLLHVATLYRDREATGPVSMAELPISAQVLLGPYRVWGGGA